MINQKRIFDLFLTSQCSWCARFYTNEPFLCPHGRLQSNCASFNKLSDTEGWLHREYKAEVYLPRIIDMMVADKGLMSMCRSCGALNPNPRPRNPTCWNCQESLCCPEHPSLILKYYIIEDYWRCQVASHSEIYHRKSTLVESKATEVYCPKCLKHHKGDSPILYYDAQLMMLKCKDCNRMFTYHKGKLVELKYKKKK